MNVYDFDGTIFSSDCSIGFCIWCMNHHPKLWLTFFPKAIKNLIISASPACIIEPIARRLGVNFMATEYDREYGVLLNNLMYAREKAKYIFDHGFPAIENFYSDSLADTPLALCAEKAHLVTNKASTVIDWPDLDEETMSKVKKKIDTGWNIHLEE